jgi:N-acetylneuraminic acid mutarotase
MKRLVRRHVGLVLFAAACSVVFSASEARGQNGVWTAVAPMPEATAGGTAAVIGGKLYVAGNNAADHTAGVKAEAYDPVSNAWTAIANFPYPYVAYPAGAAVGGRFYVIGGCQSEPGTGPDCRIGSTNAVEVYDPSTNAWSSGPAMPTARNNPTAGVIDGKIYVAGGGLPYGDNVTNVLEVFDPVAGTWAEKSPEPTARQDAAGAVINGKFYVAGGWDGTTQTTYARLEIYDPTTDMWTEGAPLPVPNSGLTGMGVAANGLFYVIGGVQGNALVNTVYAYDPPADKWTSVAPIPVTGGGYLSGVGAVNGVIYVAGGQNGFDPIANVEAFYSSPQTVLQYVISLAGNLVSSGVLNQGQGRSLAVKLQEAIGHLNGGNNHAAAGEIQAFLNEVNSLVGAGILSSAQAATLTGPAQVALAGIQP